MNAERLHELTGLLLKVAEELGNESAKVPSDGTAEFAQVHSSFCVSCAANSALDAARALLDARKAARGLETQTAAGVV